MSEQSATNLFRSLAASLPDSGECTGGAVSTIDFLSSSGNSPERPFTCNERHAIERLGRKVDIAKKVWVSYDAGWNKPVDKSPLPPSAWAALIAGFLHYAAIFDAPSPEGRGPSLKFINTALNAIDLYIEAGDAEHADILSRCAVQQMEKILQS